MDAWPEDWVPEDVFRAYVAERAEGLAAGTPERTEKDLASLYLACACVRGVPAAVQAFEDSFVVEIRRAGQRARLSDDGVVELTQALRQELLVGREGRRPKLAEYGGRGDLRGWLRVTAMRAAIKVKKRQGAPPAGDSELLGLRSAGDDPELSYMKALYGDAFRSAFLLAVGALEPREKEVLRKHFVEGMTIDDLGSFYRIHRATAARWVQAAREKLLGATRREFAHRAQVSPKECDSVLRLVQSRFNVTLRRLLA